MEYLWNNTERIKESFELMSYINRMINSSRKSPVVKHINGMTCVVEEFRIEKIDEEMDDIFDNLTNGIKDSIRYIYMVDMPTFVNKCKVKYESDTEYTNRKLINRVNRFIKCQGHHEKDMIRIIMNDRTLYVYISKSRIINIMTIEFFESQEICLIRKNVIDGDKVVMQGIGSMILSRKKESANIDFLKEHNLITLENSNDYLNMISDSLNLYIKGINEFNSNDYQYLSTEMKIFMQLYNTKNNPKLISIDIVMELEIYNELALSDDNISVEKIRILSNNNFGTNSFNNVLKDIDSGIIPFCNFTKREWNFVSKHMNDSNLDFIKSDCVDLFDILNNQIYGPTVQFKYDNIDIITHYVFDEKIELVKFYILHKINSNITVYKTFVCNCIHNFNCLDSLIFMEFRVLQHTTSSDNLMRSIAELTKIFPECIVDRSESLKVLERALSIYLIIHDRPKRHCIVREEFQETTDEDIPAVKVSKVRNKKDTNKISIKRILLPVKSAKEYIRINSSNSNNDRIYTIEEWERSGHYRHLKNGKTVWINKTTCKRHKPITTDTQIVIKL